MTFLEKFHEQVNEQGLKGKEKFIYNEINTMNQYKARLTCPDLKIVVKFSKPDSCNTFGPIVCGVRLQGNDDTPLTNVARSEGTFRKTSGDQTGYDQCFGHLAFFFLVRQASHFQGGLQPVTYFLIGYTSHSAGCMLACPRSTRLLQL